MTTDLALLKIAAVTAHAVADTLRELCGLKLEPGPALVLGDGEHQLADVALPAVVARADHVGGAGGAVVLALPIAAARQLAAAMMGAEPPTGETADLSEIEHAAFAQAAGEALGAGARAIGGLLSAEVELDAAAITVVSAGGAGPEPDAELHGARVDLMLAGVPVRLAQLVPDALVEQLTRTLDTSLARHEDAPLKAALRDIPVRAWVELGRATLPLGRLVGLPPGEVVELDRAVDDPVDLYVDGMLVARGRLVVSDSGEFLTIAIESIAHAEGALAAHAAAVPLAGSAAAA